MGEARRLLVVDPGKTTGWGFLDWVAGDKSSATFRGGEMGHEDFIDWSAVLISNHVSVGEDRPVTGVLCEGFTVSQRTVKEANSDAVMWSVKQIGILETWCRWYGHVPFQRCMPADKSFDKDGAKLKRLGWWAPLPGVTGEQGHRRDAGRHAVKWAVDHNVIDLRSLLQ